MSNQPVTPRKWRAARVLIGVICAGGIALVAALALGAADPPSAPVLHLDTTAPASDNPLPAPPYTLDLITTNGGAPDSAWGVWIGADEHDAQVFLIDNQGYISITQGSERDWTPFIHAQPETNALTLNVEADGAATFRINGEIAWRGTLVFPPESRWGIVTDSQTPLQWKRVRVFAS